MKPRVAAWIVGSVTIGLTAAVLAWSVRQATTADLIVYKSAACGCCDLWVAHLRQQGLRVYVRSQEDLAPVRARYGVPAQLASCHTARAGNYTIEGHVPASAIRRLLQERPQVAGLAVPGMPIGSPGMEQGDRHEPYTVLAFDADGHTHEFERH